MTFPYIEMEVVKRCGSDEELGYFLIQTKEERNGWEVAEVRPDIPDQAKVANLLASAPDLLEALEAAMAFIDCHAADPDLTAEMCEKYAALRAANPEAAIAKARGEA